MEVLEVMTPERTFLGDIIIMYIALDATKATFFIFVKTFNETVLICTLFEKKG